MQCPLCQSKDIKKLESVAVSDLKKLYQKLLGKAVLAEFKNISEIGFQECQNCHLKFFAPTVVGSENFYKLLQKFQWYYVDEKNEYEYAQKFIKPNDSVLEVGSGKGKFAEKIGIENYTGLEFSPDAIAIAQANGIKLINQTVEEHAKSNAEKYDVVCSFQVLEHIVNPAEFLEASLQCLKSNGLLIFAVPSDDSFLSYAFNSILNLPPHHQTRWSNATFEKIAGIFNLEKVEIYQEELQKNHKLTFARSQSADQLYKIRGKKRTLLDLTFSGKIIGLVSGFMALFKQFTIKTNAHKGHTVVAVYRKK